MVYKIGNITDLATIPITDGKTFELLNHHTRVLTSEYGQERNVDEDDGGYILYAVPGTSAEELKAFFDFSKHLPEHVDQYDTLCESVYLLNNDFAVVVIISISDAPTEILNEIEY